MIRAIPAALAVAVLSALSLGALIVVGAQGLGADARLGAADWRALDFTVKQAALSAVLSTALALPAARALSRRRFRGRGAVVALLGAPFLLPAVVAILGVVMVWGRSGWISDALAAGGFARLNIYGLSGVLLAHVFFNAPLATRLILAGYDGVPAERWRAAAQLGLSGGALFRIVEWPAIRRAAFGALSAVFMICVASFAVALMLGGGPRATTLELAIYQAARYDFNLSKAALLAGLQLGLCMIAALLAARFSAGDAAAPGLARNPKRYDGAGRGARALDGAALGLMLAFLGLPLLAAVLRGLRGAASLDAQLAARIADAAGRSLWVALASAALALALALPIAAAAARRRRGAALLEALGMAPVAASPLVIGLALLIVVRPYADPSRLAPVMAALVNAAMAAPFALRALLPALAQAEAEQGRLCDSLGVRGAARWRILLWPRLRRPAGFAMGLAAALSAGDLGVIALFADPSAPTLPLLAQLLAESRQLDAAMATALSVAALSFGLFWTFDRLGRGANAAD